MGRHAKGAPRLRVSVSTVVLGTLIVTVVAAGSLLSSRVESTPIGAQAVDGAAIVVLSPVCDGISGRTLVDVVDPIGLPVGTTVRTSIDGCGLTEGDQVAVQFPVGDPAQASLAGSGAGNDTTSGTGLLPYGIAIALLLAVAAAVVVWIDGRRRAGRPVRNPMHEVVDSDDSLIAGPWSTAVAPQQVSVGSGRHARPEDDPIGVGGHHREDLDRGLTSVDLVFPSSASLAASLHDELFTHRTV